MTLVLDSRLVPAAQRAEAVNAAMSDSEVPHTVSFADEDEAAWHRLDYWDLGGGAHVLRQVGTGMRIVRGPKHLRIAAPERVAVGLQIRGHGSCVSAGVELSVPEGHLHLVDQTGLYDFSWHGVAGSKAFMVDCDRLEVPIDLVRKAMPNLRSSPVYELFRSHLATLGTTDVELPGEPARSMLGSATVELLRALVVSAAGDDDRQQQSLQDTLVWRVQQYLEAHLREPNLNATRVAAAHNISVRQLYKVWPSTERSLADWIIHARLQGAGKELMDPGSAETTVAALAHRWGFADATHFARRFREAYGMSPSEWRLLHR